MKAIKYLLWGGLTVISLLWWAADQTNFLALEGVFAWRNVLTQYSGIVGISVMSLAMMLAVRPVFLERHVDGLDKMYRLHKWLGITGLVVSVSHWLIVSAPKWAVGLGWLARPSGRRGRSCRKARYSSFSPASAAWPKASASGRFISPSLSCCWP
jgi:predicted ferric reductase